MEKNKKSATPKKNHAYSFSKSQIYRIYQIAMSGKLAIGDGVLWTSPCKRGEAERNLETAAAKAMSLGRLWQATTGDCKGTVAIKSWVIH